MYIHSLKVRDLRAVASAKVELLYPGRVERRPGAKIELPRPRLDYVNLILGENGAGKSTLLDGIALGVLSPIIAQAGFRPHFLIRRGRDDKRAERATLDIDTGANSGGGRIAMTEPVETGGRLIAITVPVEQGAAGTMRFYLPRKVAAAGAPEPTGPGVRLVRFPSERLAVLRFSGSATPEARRRQAGILTEVLDKAGRNPAEPPFFMGYDPPFSVPLLRRNEVAVRLPPPET